MPYTCEFTLYPSAPADKSDTNIFKCLYIITTWTAGQM